MDATAISPDGRWIVGNGYHGRYEAFLVDMSPPSAGAPTVVSGSATSITGHSAEVAGNVTPNGASTTWQYHYGTTTAYGSVAPLVAGNAGDGFAPVAVQATLTGLQPSTTYHYRLEAVNSAGTTYGADATFTTVNNTPPGSNVPTTPVDEDTRSAPITLTFANVTTPGDTTLTITSPDATPTPPPDPEFQLGTPPTYYDIETTADFTGSINLCINYTGVTFTDESSLRLLHFDGSAWVDVTTSHDSVNDVICGTVSSLSPFAIVQPVPAPVASFTANPNPAGCQQLVQFTSTSFSPDPLRSVVLHQWDFHYDGTSFHPTASGFSVNHPFPAFGNHTVMLRVTDDLGQTASTTSVITVNQGNLPPVAHAGGPYAVVTGSGLTLDASASSDPDVLCGDHIVLYEWDLDHDGSWDVGAGSPSIALSAAQLAGWGLGSIGLHTIGLRVIDSFGLTGTAFATVNVTAPPPPVAPPLAFVRSPGLTLKIRITDILAQCSDPGGNPLTLQSLGSSSQGAAVVLGPSHVLYTPVNDRTDTFTYTIANSLGITATGQITVTVTNPGGLVQSIDTSGGVVTIQFAGIPGYTYDVQRTVDFSAWNTLDTITASGLGLFSFTDPNPPQPFAAYRLMQDWSPFSNYWGDGADGALYASGDVAFPVATDGDVVVRRFTSLTINEGHTVTTQNRCRGLVIYVDGDAVINGTLSMTARGANVNPTLPDSIAPTGIRLIRFKTGSSASLAASELGGAGAGGVGALWRNVEAHQAGATENGIVYRVAREGGAGAPPCNGPHGYSGSTALDGTGGGGSGTSNDGWGGGGSAGSCYSGGSGGGSAHCQGVGEAGHPFGGPGGAANGGWCGQDDAPGGGAGNPGGYSHWAGWPAESGTGGLLVLMVRGNLSIGAQGKITSEGSQGGEYVFAGGSSGGGRIIVLHAGTMNNGGVIRAAGGEGRLSAQGYQGGHGGDGAVTVDQIDP